MIDFSIVPLIAVPVSGLIWLIWRFRNDAKGAWTNKSPERFSQDYRVVRNQREGK